MCTHYFNEYQVGEYRDVDYLGKLDRLIAKYSTLVPFTNDVETFHRQHQQNFMVIALAGITTRT